MPSERDKTFEDFRADPNDPPSDGREWRRQLIIGGLVGEAILLVIGLLIYLSLA